MSNLRKAVINRQWSVEMLQAYEGGYEEGQRAAYADCAEYYE